MQRREKTTVRLMLVTASDRSIIELLAIGTDY